MTVAELIEKLREMPQDAVILVHKNCGCCDWLPEANLVTLVRKGEKNSTGDVEAADGVMLEYEHE